MAYDIIDPKRPNWVFAEDVPRSAPKPINGPSPLRQAAGAAVDTARRAGESLRGAASAVADKMPRLDTSGAGKVLNANLGSAGKLLRGGAGLGAATAVGETLLTTAGVPQEDYEQRTGLRSDSFLGSMGVRAAGALQDIGNKVTFGLADRVGNAISGGGFVRSAGNQVGEWGGPGAEMPGAKAATPPTPTSAPATSPAAPAESPWLPSAAVGLQNVLGTLNAGGPITDTAGRIVRNGNSYSGSNIAAGAEILDQRTGRTRGGNTVSSMNFSEGLRGALRAADIDRQNIAIQREIDAYGPGTTPGGALGINGRNTLSRSLRDQFDATPSASVLTPDGMSTRRFREMQSENRRAADDRDARLAMASMEADTAVSGQNATLRAAGMREAAARDIAALNNTTERRGQDMTLEGRMAPILAEQAKRARLRTYMDAAGGSSERAAQMAAANGDLDSSKSLMDGVKAKQDVSSQRDDQVRKRTDDLVGLLRNDSRFMLKDNNGKPYFDEAGARAAAAGMVGEFGDKLAGMDPASKQKALVDFVSRSRLQEKMRTADPGFWGGIGQSLGLSAPTPANVTTPNLRGAGAPELAGPLAILRGKDPSATKIRLQDGSVYDLGQLTADELRIINEERAR